MDRLFLAIINMSMTGAFVISAICLARLPLKKAPKIISYCLWAVAGFRLVFPFSIESVFSLIPFKAQTISTDIAMQPISRIYNGMPAINNIVGGAFPNAAPVVNANPLQMWIVFGAFMWFAGVFAMLVYGVASFFILKREMEQATNVEMNIYEAENIKTPFVLGIFKPNIYLPVGISEREKSYVVLHEQTHIRRRDHIVKFAAYFVLCLHWFNPFAWLAFLLMGVDMEMSCDERVLKEIGSETKKAYSMSLLSLATERRIIGGSPLAFGEGGVKERVKNVLNFKKSSRIMVALAVILTAFLSVGFATNREEKKEYKPETVTFTSEDGLAVTADLYKTAKKTAPYIILFHQECSGGEGMAAQLNEMGFNCLAVKHKMGWVAGGVQNKHTIELLRYGAKCMYAYSDLKAALSYTKDELKAKSIIIEGSSCSASLSLILGSEFPEDVSAILAFSPGEYFKFNGKGIEDYAADIKCPVFITAEERGTLDAKVMYDKMPSGNKVYCDEDVYVSSVLYGTYDTPVWERVKDFLNEFI